MVCAALNGTSHGSPIFDQDDLAFERTGLEVETGGEISEDGVRVRRTRSATTAMPASASRAAPVGRKNPA
jgi:hypothetical protein